MFSFLHLAQSVPIFSEFLPKAHGPGGPLERPHVNFSCVTSVLHVLTNYHVFMTSVNYMYMCHIMRLCDMEHHVHTRTALIPIRRSRPLDKLDLVCTSKQFVGEPSTFAKKRKTAGGWRGNLLFAHLSAHPFRADLLCQRRLFFKAPMVEL